MELSNTYTPAASRLKWKTASLVFILFFALIATFGYHYKVNSNEQHKLELYSQRNMMVTELVTVIGLRAKIRGLGLAIITEDRQSPQMRGEFMRRIGNLEQATTEFRRTEAEASTALTASMNTRLSGWHRNTEAFNESTELLLEGKVTADSWLELSNSLIEYELELNRHLLMPASDIEWVRLFAEIEQDAASLVHYAGQQRALIKTVLIEGKAISPDLAAKLSALNGSIDGYLSKLKAASLLDALPVDLKNSLILFNNVFNNQLKRNYLLIEEQSRSGTPYTMTPTRWWKQASNAIDSAENIASNTGQLMHSYLQKLHSQQHRMNIQVVAEAAVLLLFISIILTWLLSMLFRSIKEVNAKQAESHKYYRAILGCPVGILICDDKGRVEFANEAYLRNSATSLDEVLNRTLADVLDIGDKALNAQLPERIREGRSLTAEVVCQATNLSYDARLFVTPIKEERGENMVNYLAIVDNIAEQKVLEKQLLRYQSKLESEVESRTAELAQSEARAHAIFAMAASAIITIDKQGIIRDINPAASEMFGYKSIQLVGQNISILMPKPYSEEHDDYLSSYQRSGQKKVIGINREVKAQHCNGQIFPIQLSISEVKTETDHFFVGMITDISERKAFEEGLKRAKDQAEQASEIKSNFLANISHEIRTPMNAIIGMTEVVLEGSVEDEQRKHLSIVLQSAKSLLEILNQVLDLAKLEDGSVGLSLVDFNLRGLVNEVLSPFAFTAKSRKLDFIIEVDDSLAPYYSGDTLRIRQVLSNLVGNAIKFTESGFVHIKIGCGEAGRVRFEVIDSGIGISDEMISSIFDSFTQADNSISRRFGGTGLGTTISKQLVELMGGTISVSSELGIGSTFRFEVPMQVITNPAIQSNKIATKHNQVSRSLEILVAEDQSANQELIKLRLGRAGHQVTLACDGREAIRAFREKRFDIILMDVHMPKADGFEATRSIRRIEAGRQQSPTPIIALSASVLKKEQNECRASGMDGFVAKPIDFTLLQDTINSFFNADASEAAVTGQEESSPVEDNLLFDPVAGTELWGDIELYSKTLAGFVSNLPTQCHSLTLALEEDLLQAKEQAHSIKGAAANLKLIRLASLCDRMEIMLAKVEPNATCLASLAEQIETVATLTKTSVTEYLATTAATTRQIICENSDRTINLLQQIREIALSGQLDTEALKQLQRTAQGGEIDRLIDHIDAFAFDEAVVLIEEILLKLDSAEKKEALDEL